MNTHLLLTSALRTLIMGVTLFAALRLLRIHQVRAQRTAWLLALIAALAMPALVGGGIGLHVLPSPAHNRSIAMNTAPVPVTYPPGSERMTVTPATLSVAPLSQATVSPQHSRHWPISYAATLYCLVAGFLLVRLAVGFALAMRLRRQAVPADCIPLADTDIRISHRIITPVTIASSVLLPASSTRWDEAKLRVVLSHESAHVHQHDFYIQLLAGLNCAIFWFNPFSWWLQNHLSALGEAMSDLAAVEQAESRTSYAAVLLEFATTARWPLTGVAMARTSSLRVRIERLLSEQLFEQSYTGKRRLPLAAAALGILAVCASTSLTRVHAAQATATPAPPASAQPIAAPEADPHPEANLENLSRVTTEGPSSRATEGTNAPAEPQEASQDIQTPPAAPDAPPVPSYRSHSSYNYNHDDNGDSYALVMGDDRYTFSGDWQQREDLESIQKNTHGNFIYYRHDGKSYVIDDPAIVARARALYAPMEALGKQQEALGRQQEALGRRQSSVKIQNPDLSKETAALDKALQQMKQLAAEKEVDRESLSRLQEQIGEIQGRLGELQGEAGEQQGKIGAEQGALGEQQGKLGEAQRHLGEMQGKLGEEAHRQIIPMIQQAIQNGKAKPVN